MMTIYEWIQAIILFGTLCFVGLQGWLMRRAINEQRMQIEEQRNQLIVQSYFQIWLNHVNTCHLPIALGDKDIAEQLNKMTPYYNKKLEHSRKAHFADAVFDLYECINLLGRRGFIDSEVERVWKESVLYEMYNPNLRKHWRTHHRPAYKEKDIPSKVLLYHKNFADYVEECISMHEKE